MPGDIALAAFKSRHLHISQQEDYVDFPLFIDHSCTGLGLATAPYCMHKAIQAKIEAYNCGVCLARR